MPPKSDKKTPSKRSAPSGRTKKTEGNSDLILSPPPTKPQDKAPLLECEEEGSKEKECSSKRTGSGETTLQPKELQLSQSRSAKPVSGAVTTVQKKEQQPPQVAKPVPVVVVQKKAHASLACYIGGFSIVLVIACLCAYLCCQTATSLNEAPIGGPSERRVSTAADAVRSKALLLLARFLGGNHQPVAIALHGTPNAFNVVMDELRAHMAACQFVTFPATRGLWSTEYVRQIPKRTHGATECNRLRLSERSAPIDPCA